MSFRPPATRSALTGAALALAAAGCGDARESAATAAQEGDVSNFRVLTPRESRALVAYADATYACVQGEIDLAKPVAERLRIVMTTSAPVGTAARALAACEKETGPPPSRTSLQARQGEIVLYLPKRCLLDPKVEREVA